MFLLVCWTGTWLQASDITVRVVDPLPVPSIQPDPQHVVYGERKVKSFSKTSYSKASFDRVDSILALDYVPNTAMVNDPLTDIYAQAQKYYGNPKVLKAAQISEAINEARLLDKLTGAELVNLPIGIRKSIGNNTYLVMITQARLLPNYAVLEVFCRVDLSDGRVLFFGSDDVKFSSEGGFIGETTLGLFDDFPISKGSRKMAITLNKFERRDDGNHKGCYVRIDCDGFVDMKVDALLSITRDWVLPATPNGDPIGGLQRVEAEFALTLTDWDDMVVDISMPHFVLTKTPEVAFMVDRAVIDFSDVRNASDFRPPPDLTYVANSTNGTIGQNNAAGISTSLSGVGSASSSDSTATNNLADPNLWRGVYFRQVEIIFPKVLKDDGGQRIVAGAENLYIDSKGVTGKFFVENALPYEVGRIQKWRFSIDELNVETVYSKVFRFGFQGRIGMPIADKTKPLQYFGSANLEKEIYNIGVATVDSTSFPLWKAGDVSFYPGSKVSVTVADEAFQPKAILSGRMNIEVTPGNSNSNTSLDIADIDFRKIIVQTTAPYIGLSNQGGSITLTTGAVLNDSPLTISSASLVRKNDTEIKFAMGMNVDLMSEEDGGLRTGGDLAIVGKLEEESGAQEWTYAGLELLSLLVEIKIGEHVWIKGGIENFANDPIYGDGFRGRLQGGFIKGEPYKFNMEANAIFGTAAPGSPDAYRYWFFDAFVSSDLISVPLVPGVLNANGFGGGAYHHMKMDDVSTAGIALSDGMLPGSGVSYSPNQSVALGLKASIGLKGAGGSFNGVATLELAFTPTMGLADIMFYGKGEFVAPTQIKDFGERIQKLPLPKSTAEAQDQQEAQSNIDNKIAAALFLRLNFEGGFEMHGSFAAYLAAAQGTITGQGTIDLLLSPKNNKWHIYIGGYSDNSVVNHSTLEVIPPISASINYGAFQVSAGLYFLTGNDIPGAPPIHPQAAAFFGISTNSNNRDILNTGGRSPATGTGFAFGAFAFFDFEHKDGKTCRACCFPKRDKYVRIWGGVGFDISLLKYDHTTRCANSGTSPQGANGWRAGGRLWAFVEVKGRWKLVGACIGVPHTAVGLMLDGDVPNPSFFRATIKLKIIGISIRGSAKIGTECGIVLN